MNITFCARWGQQSWREWDKAHPKPLRISQVAKYVFCRHCAQAVKRRLERERAQTRREMAQPSLLDVVEVPA